jgi:hypothetical protein
MANWTNISDVVLEPGKPIRSVDTIALRDNPVAIAEGASGAPRLVREALDAQLTTMLIEGTYKNQPRWFFSSGSHTIAANVLHMIMVVGGGGGGGRSASGSIIGLGGNGADLVIKWVKPASNTALTITVGSGGNGSSSNGVAGADGSNSTVVGTGINIVAAGGRGGIANQANSVKQRNPDNSASSGGDYVAKGGRSRFEPNDAGFGVTSTGGSSLFGNIGGFSGDTSSALGATINSSAGNPFYDYDTNTGNASVVTSFVPEINQGYADSIANNTITTNRIIELYQNSKRTIFDLLLPANLLQPIADNYSAGNGANSAAFAFSGSIGVGGSASGTVVARRGGRGAGGTGRPADLTGPGGAGFVVIWSFANV